MTNPGTFELLDLDPDAPDYEARLNELLSGTYNSGWTKLKMAAASSIMVAAEQTARLNDRLGRVRAKCSSQAEVKFVTDFNYDIALLGPCLSGVLLTAFSLEGFLRLGMYIALEGERDLKRRRAGYDKQIIDRLAEFEALHATARVHALAKTLGLRPLRESDPRLRAAQYLITYRNECVHETPSITLARGAFERVMTGKRPSARRITSHIGPYLRLSLANRPARLIHAVRAVETHDALVSFFISEAAPLSWLTSIAELDPSPNGQRLLSSLLFGNTDWERVRRLAELWESGPEVTTSCSDKESREFALGLRRRVRVNAVR